MSEKKQEEKLPLFIQYTLSEIQEEIPEVAEYFFDQFKLKIKYISEALNLISKKFPNKKYELHQYVHSIEYPDVLIFKLKR